MEEVKVEWWYESHMIIYTERVFFVTEIGRVAEYGRHNLPNPTGYRSVGKIYSLVRGKFLTLVAFSPNIFKFKHNFLP